MKLDISPYAVTLQAFKTSTDPVTSVTTRDLVDVERTVDMAGELYAILRIDGIYQSLAESVDAILLAKKIHAAKPIGEVDIDDTELAIITKAIDVLLQKAAEGKVQFGGVVHETLFLRLHGRS